MAVSPQGDTAFGSFYALDPAVIPWNLTKPIYKYTAVTLFVSNFNTSALSQILGVNLPTAATTLVPYRVFLVVQGVQRNAPAIASDIESTFGLQPGSFTALASNPLTLPVSVFGANLTSNPYSDFVGPFVQKAGLRCGCGVLGKYTASLLETSSSGMIFNSVESLNYPVSPFFGATNFSTALFGAQFNFAFGLNATGAFIVEKKLFDFSQAQDHTLSFGSLLGETGGISSTTNETFATVLPGGAQVNGFSPSNMLVQSSATATIVLAAFPWVGTSQRLLPDVSVTFHYPAFNSPVLTASWTNTGFNVGQNFTLTLNVMNQGGMDAQKLHLTLGFAGLVYWNGTSYTMNPVQYDVGTLAQGAANTRSFLFGSSSPEASFTLDATFLDPQNFAYSWSKSFSVAPNIKQNGPLTVTKSVSPTNPSSGQQGTVTVKVKNTDLTAGYYNILDLTPEAFPFLYPTGSTVTGGGCLPSFGSLEANNTYFTFQVSSSCGSEVLTQVWVQSGSHPLTLVSSPNIPLSSGSSWSPIPPLPFPAGWGLTFGQFFMVQLVFRNGQSSSFSSINYAGPLPPLGNARSSYLSLGCAPCPVAQGATTTISGVLLNSTALPITFAPVQISYRIPSNNTLRVLGSNVTDASGHYSFNWFNTGGLPVGTYTLIANYTGSVKYNASSESIQFTIVVPTTIGPGGTITFTYPYFFNVTGPITLSPERIAYSSATNVTRTKMTLIGEYVAASSPVSLVVSASPIFLVVDTAMNATRLSLVYAAQNQSYVQISLTVSNTGPQTATGVAVSSWIPRCLFAPSCKKNSWLPVTSAGPGVTVDNTRGTVSFSVASLAVGQQSSSWYVVKASSANSTTIWQTTSNVTGLVGIAQYRFAYSGAGLAVYSTTSVAPPIVQGFLQAFVTTNPSVIANGTSTVATVNLFNAGNVTYTSINATVKPSFGLSFNRNSTTVPSMLPGTFQTVSFTATASSNIFFPSTSASFFVDVFYNESSTTHCCHTGPSYKSVLVYDSKVAGFNPSVTVAMSGTSSVSAGAADFVVVTVTNTGTVNMTNIELTVKAYSPLFNPSGVSQPETAYGGYFNTYYDNWRGTFTAGQTVKFRIGIQTRAGGLYPVFVDYANWNFAMPSTNSFTGFGQVSASNMVLITATDTTGPLVSNPWTSPFGPTSSDAVRVWAQASDESGLGSVKLEYSTDKQTWTSVAMTPLIGYYVTAQSITNIQSAFGDIYNATIPAQASGTIVYYRVRANDTIRNPTLQDNNGIDYMYAVVGSKSAIFKPAPGTNIQLDVSQSIPTLRSLVTFNVSTPLSLQITQLPSIPAGVTPSGLSPLGIYASISENCSAAFDSRIRFYYSTSQVQGLNATTIAPYYWGGSGWLRLDNVVVNTSLNYTEGTAHHFSLFAVFASPATTTTPPPTTPQPSSQIPWVLIGAIVVVVAIAALLGLLLLRRRKRQVGVPSAQAGPAGPSVSGSPMPPEPSPKPSDQ